MATAYTVRTGELQGQQGKRVNFRDNPSKNIRKKSKMLKRHQKIRDAWKKTARNMKVPGVFCKQIYIQDLS